jgi:hypothetical protein
VYPVLDRMGDRPMPPLLRWLLTAVLIALVAVLLNVHRARGDGGPAEGPAPRLAAADLVGVWEFRWGTSWDGQVTFYRDGTYWMYCRRHDRRSVGTWRLEGEVLRITDHAVLKWKNMEPADDGVEHEVAVRGADPGFLCGNTPSGDGVQLFDRRPFDDARLGPFR